MNKIFNTAAKTASVALLTLLASGDGNAQKADSRHPTPDIVRFLAAGIKNSREGLSCGQANVVIKNVEPKELSSPPEKEDKVTTTSVAWHIKDEQISMSVLRFLGDSKTPIVSEALVADAAQAKVLTGQNMGNGIISYSGAILPAAEVIDTRMWKENRLIDPRHYAYLDSFPIDETLLWDKCIFKVEEETIDGDICSKITVTNATQPTLKAERIVWIDAQHSFLVRRSETYFDYRGKKVLFRRSKITKIVNSGGVWFPAEVKVEEFEGALDGDFDSRPVTQSVMISDFKAECEMPKEVFQLDWPTGTDVSNSITGEFFVAKATKTTRDVKKSAADNTKKKIPVEDKR